MTVYQYSGTGFLVKSSNNIGALTFNYNESSILYNTPEDYGTLAEFSDDFSNTISNFSLTSSTFDSTIPTTEDVSVDEDDYGLITQPSGPTIDFNLINDPVFGIYFPFGTITLSGSAITQPNYRLFISGQSLVKTSYAPQITGTLFGFGEKLESVTYDYSPDSIFDATEDYQSVNISPDFIDDYGIISQPSSLTIDFNLISDSVSDSSVPFGKITLSGSAITQPNYRLFISGQSLVKTSYTPQITYGTLFGFGEKLENITYDYNESSIVDNEDDYGLVSETDLQFIDYDFITGFGGSQPDENYGLISEIITNLFDYPFGSLFVSGIGLESISPQGYTGIGTLSLDISSRNYSTVYPRNADDPSAGIGTITINDDRDLTTISKVVPYTARGSIFVSGTNVERISKSNDQETILFNISGIASTKEIAVYTAVGSGVITLSQTARERNIDSYDGSGTLVLSGFSPDIQIQLYSGIGTIFNTFGAAESFVSQTPEDTQLFTISGSATESYSAQTPETEVLYQLSGNIIESRTYEYEGSGQITFGSDAIIIFRSKVFGVGGFRFATYLGDNLYDTCDSVNITCDYQDSAFVKFVANPSENIVLYNFGGSASTTEIQVYTYSGLGSVGISGSHIIRKTNSVVGIGTLTITSTAVKKDISSYIGSGSIAVLSGSAQSKVSIIPQSTILFSISGVSSTRIVKVRTYSGIGTAYFNGSASTRVLSSRSYSGVGTIYLSGELVYPDVKYIPAPKGSGFININGYGLENIGRKYLPIIQPLFFFSGGFESFSETGYIGIGTIYIQSTSASSINNPYQIPRVYVTII